MKIIIKMSFVLYLIPLLFRGSSYRAFELHYIAVGDV